MGEDVEISVTETTNIIEITPQPNDQIVDIGVIDNAPNVDVNVTPSVIEINVTRGSSTAIWGSITGNLTDQGDLVSTLALKADLVAGKVPSSQLPSYVDDVIEVANYAALPTTGETGKIYITINNNHIFRWTGSTYVEITDNTAVWGAITGTLSSQSDLQTALNGKFNNPTGNTTQYIAGDGSLITFPISGQAGTIVREIRNTTGSTLTKGTIVYISGANGNKPTVSKAIATGDSTSAQTFGFVQADIANNANGYVVTIGDLIGLDTSAISEGTQLYLSSTTAGTYTTTKQIAPAHLVYVGIVTRSHPTQGQIEVKVQNGYELDEIHDVLIISKTNKDFLNYDSASGLWKNKSLATILAGSSSQFVKGDGTLDSNTYALTSQLHNAVTIGTANGLSLSTQVLSLGLSSSSTNGALSSTDWTNFNNKQNAIGYTPANDSTVVHLTGNESINGIKTFIGNSVILDPTGTTSIFTFKASGALVAEFSFNSYFTQFSSKATGGYLFKNTASENALTIADNGNGVFLGNLTATAFIRSGGTSSQFLKADGSVDNSTYYLASNPNGYTSNSGTVTSVAALTLGITGTDISSTVANGSTTPVITLNIPTASATNRGALSSTDWNTFNSKQNALTNPITGTGNAGYIPKFTAGTTIGNSAIYENSGYVGIGTTIPTYLLTVAMPTSGTGVAFRSFGNTNNPGLFFSVNESTTVSQINASGSTSGILALATDNIEHMRITSVGKVGIGTISPNGALSVKYNPYSSRLVDLISDDAVGNATFIQFNTSATNNIGSIARAGFTPAIVFNTTSDYRLKEDFKEINGLDIISKIKVYDFKWKGIKDRMDGVIAHELQEVVPYAVTGEKDAEQMQSVDYSKLVPILVQAIKELKTEIDLLKQK